VGLNLETGDAGRKVPTCGKNARLGRSAFFLQIVMLASGLRGSGVAVANGVRRDRHEKMAGLRIAIRLAVRSPRLEKRVRRRFRPLSRRRIPATKAGSLSFVARQRI